MPQHHADSVDVQNKFEDLSGIDTSAASNPYAALIEACGDNPSSIQSRYSLHRETRNAQQRAKLLSPTFPGMIVDNILRKLENPTIEPGYVDPRHCLVFWSRPPQRIRDLISDIQHRLKSVAPHLWLMPFDCLHITVFEVTHSLTAAEVDVIIKQMEDVIFPMVNYTSGSSHRARLIKPLLSFDNAAVALSFLPAAGEALPSSRLAEADAFTYHHLRRDLFTTANSSNVTIESRYVVPSAHLTVGRCVTQADHDEKEKMERWVAEIESINEWLIRELWPNEQMLSDEGQWIVGEDIGLVCRKGDLWYGGGKTVMTGRGI